MSQRIVDSYTNRRIIYTCDRCLKDDQDAKICPACKGHVCIHCGKLDDRDLSDPYPARYCRPCWKLGEPFRERIAAEQRASDERCRLIAEEWSSACGDRNEGTT